MARRGGQHRGSASRGSLVPALVVAGAVVAAGAAGTGFLVSRQEAGRTPSSSLSAHHAPSTGDSHHHAPLSPPTPLGVLGVSPSGASAGSVSWSQPVTVSFNQPLSATSPLPTLSPAVPGSWQRVSPTTLRFVPSGNYIPYSKETVTVPATATSARGRELGMPVTAAFTVKGGSVLRLQELLAELGYLPVSFTPSGGPMSSPAVTTTAPGSYTPAPPPPASAPVAGGAWSHLLAAPAAAPPVDHEPSSPFAVPVGAEPGTFTWRFPSIPRTLASLWQAGQPNVITTGAVMAFESAHNLAADGVAGPLVWSALLRAAAAHQVTSAPYDYVYVSTGYPEYVTVWRDGVNIFTTLANTGIPEAPTAVGTWPVYVRYLTTTMSGTNPNGTPYSDPGIPWVSYFNGGDALHGFIRASYGFPQSLGCVEMPFAAAQIVYPLTPLGTLVTIE
jgi:peptidoglycan hydrolase-like protein with peptidoglycan-binding domain